MKLVPDQIARWLPGRLYPLGTDGFGRSETREALRRFFEVDAECIALAALGSSPSAGRSTARPCAARATSSGSTPRSRRHCWYGSGLGNLRPAGSPAGRRPIL